MNTTLRPDLTVGELVSGNPLRARVFEQYQIDYCCGGGQLLTDACAKQSLMPQEVLDALDALESDLAARTETVDWTQESLNALVEHLLTTHHVYLKEELPRLQHLVDKVAHVHGANHPELAAVRSTYMQLVNELMPHLMKEEMILFPLIQRMEAAGSGVGAHCGSIGNPISVMLHEHDIAGDLLARLRDITHGYAPPADACGSYLALYAGLADLEFDTHLHIHKENTLLFPRAQALEDGDVTPAATPSMAPPSACQLPAS
jgi:regulator of cell morphogenesis and NO signaling